MLNILIGFGCFLFVFFSRWIFYHGSVFHYSGKEGNVLFNNTINTFYVWLYGIGHMVKDHSDSD